MHRSAEIADFLDASTAALRAACTDAALAAAERVIARCPTPGAPGAQPARLPVCDWIAPALAAVPPERAALARAFAALEQRLPWTRRRQSTPADGAFYDGHANAVILGPGGLEERSDLWIGATVMAPGLRYVDHDHPPEEVYLSLTPGQWWNAQMDWADPGPTGAIYNPPGIAHAMRSGAGPLLALWYLPL
jgi:hypothetical protein